MLKRYKGWVQVEYGGGFGGVIGAKYVYNPSFFDRLFGCVKKPEDMNRVIWLNFPIKFNYTDEMVKITIMEYQEKAMRYGSVEICVQS